MEKPTNLDCLLHTASLQIANIMHMSDGLGSDCPQLKDDLIMAYRCIRRHINKEGADISRFGSFSAHCAMHGDIH